jgi:hypothetical protein
MDEEAIHDLEKVLAERRATLVRVEILGRDNQRLATGTATPQSEGVHGAFWIDGLKGADTLASQAVILRRSDGTESKFVRFQRCPAAHGSLHFHFETEA